MNYYYLVFLILLFLSGVFFSNVVNRIVGIGVSILGVVSLMAYIYYYTMDEPNNTVTEWPSETYLHTIGAQCPNYWKLISNSDNNNDSVVCKYTEDLQKVEDTQLNEDCFNRKDELTYTFDRVKKITYPLEIDESRKEWREKCKYVKSGKSAPWIEYDGVN